MLEIGLGKTLVSRSSSNNNAQKWLITFLELTGSDMDFTASGTFSNGLTELYYDFVEPVPSACCIENASFVVANVASGNTSHAVSLSSTSDDLTSALMSAGIIS
eukprot:gene21489-15961_t